MYKKIRAYLHPRNHHQINFINVPSGDNTQRVTKTNEMEHELLAFHKRHFSQAQTTPFANPAFISRFGYAADTTYATNFQAGDNSKDKHWNRDAEYKFLHQIRPHPDDPPKIDTHINLTQLKKALKYGERLQVLPLVEENFPSIRSGLRLKRRRMSLMETNFSNSFWMLYTLHNN